jgi:hypothetical protein
MIIMLKGFTIRISVALLAFVLLLAVPLDAAAKAKGKKLAFGRIKLTAESGDSIELDNPGVFQSGDLFLMWVLPEAGDKATRLEVEESGEFFWKLSPGHYVVASYEWSRNAGGAAAGGMFSGRRLWADFSVSADTDATYIGTLVLRAISQFEYEISVQDESVEAPAWLTATGKNISGDTATSVMTLEDQRWQDGGIPICVPQLGIVCDKRRDGVEVITPKQTASTLFRKIKSLTPTLEWKPSTNADIRYDVVVYEAYYQKAGFLSGGGKPGGGYEAGRAVEYVEGLAEPLYQLATPLEPGKRYYWSVRLRHPKIISRWSTRRVDVMEGLRTVSKFQELYGMRYADSRKRR